MEREHFYLTVNGETLSHVEFRYIRENAREDGLRP